VFTWLKPPHPGTTSADHLPRVAAPVLSPADLIEYLVDLGGALLSYGCSTHRLESALSAIARMEGYRVDSFAVPTGLFLSLSGGELPQPLLRMVRVREWGVDLEKLALIDRIFNDVLSRDLTLAQARRLLDRIEAKPPLYSPGLALLARAGTAGGAAVFFRGGWLEIAIAAFGGLLVGLMAVLLRHARRTALLTDFAGAVVAAGVAWAASAVFPQLSREVIVLAVIILLVPGMALTTGLAELVHKNLVSGAAKLMEALVAFLSIVFGIAVVVALEKLLGMPIAAAPVLEPPEPGLLMNFGALLVTSAGFAVIFSVPKNLAPGAMTTAAVGWIVTALGVRYLPGTMAPFTAALSISLMANGIARVTQRPSQVFLLPALVLIVPGSFGFLSLESFLRGNFLHGAARGFDMFLTAGAIVTGLLVANVILPARKLL
jgi:uncharacterized membrane protein YjjP (DUF1212 family)